MADRTLVQLEALEDFRTTGLPDSSYVFPNEPLILAGTTFTGTEAMETYLVGKVKRPGDDDPTRETYIEAATAALHPYSRQPSPLPHIYEPGKSTIVPPDANFVQARLDATTEEVTHVQPGSPFGTGHADHPELYERQPTVAEADAEETQRSRRVQEVADPANT